MPTPMTAHPGGPLKGEAVLPGDKSISHRALIFGGLARGQTRIRNLLTADDVMRTAAALRGFGLSVEREGEEIVVEGGPWQSPDHMIYCGNSGTGVRLLMGAAAGQGVAVSFEGDASLRVRPMERVLEPLRDMGLEGTSTEGHLPVSLSAGSLRAITYRLPKASAQLKTAVLLAGLGAEGDTVIEEPILCRDHTERMLPAFGAELVIEEMGEGRKLTLPGRQQLKGAKVTVPGDPSSAAFLLVAGAILSGSEITLPGVLINETRIGFIETLREMGAQVSLMNEREEGGEPIADLHVRSSALKAIHLGPERAPAQIDEYPILAVAAAFAEGTTRFEGLDELRVKESDRLAATAALLTENGVTCRTGEDWLEIDGGTPKGGGLVKTHHDHRIAMSSLILGLGAAEPVTVDDCEMIATSFPNFAGLMASLGANIKEHV
nr:3-phosphoshikimate 1-carboxyvinyltransferase [Parvularcula marina]